VFGQASSLDIGRSGYPVELSFGFDPEIGDGRWQRLDRPGLAGIEDEHRTE
jgi:hypothetical protein